ncbi:MAG: glycosyltransferase [Bacteroides sp.]|nr:glycosyltransferase [Bacteroides sp.]
MITPELIQTVGFIALALTGIIALWLITAYRSRVAAVGNEINRQTDAPFNPDPRPAPPAVSIVVVAGDDSAALEQLLHKLFEQEYPSAEMEVIVINDGKNENIKDVVTRIKHLEQRPNLRLTFTPSELRNVSHRKLAVSLGVKAAKFPVVMLLTEQSRLFSNQWLARMAAPFADENVEVVIGSAMPSVKSDSGMGVRYRSFVHAFDAAEWLSAALNGRPWRGHRANLAFRRDLFFSSGGFNGALNLRGGDDDIFVSRICKPDNTRVVVAAQAHVRYVFPSARREFKAVRPARFYSARNLDKTERRFFGAASLLNWLMLLSAIIAAAAGVLLQNWPLVIIPVVILLLAWLIITLAWRKTFKALRARPSLLAIPFRLLRLPLTNMRQRYLSRRRKNDYHLF